MVDYIPANLLLDPTVLDQFSTGPDQFRRGPLTDRPEALVLWDWILDHEGLVHSSVAHWTPPDDFRRWLVYYALWEIRTIAPYFGLDESLAWLCLSLDADAILKWCRNGGDTAHLQNLSHSTTIDGIRHVGSFVYLAKTITDRFPRAYPTIAVYYMETEHEPARHVRVPARVRALAQLGRWLPPMPPNSFDFMYPRDKLGRPIIP